MNLPNIKQGDWLTIRLQWRKPASVVARIMRMGRYQIAATHEGFGSDALDALANLRRVRSFPQYQHPETVVTFESRV